MRKLITILFICLLQNGFAGTIYVSSTHGNDIIGDGSSGAPFASLYKASTVATSGDVIYFTAGNYAETQQTFLSVGVSIDGAGRDSVFISSTYPASGGAYDYWINLQSATENTNGNQFIRNVTFDGSNLTCFNGIFIKARSNISIYNCRIQNFKLAGVYWKGSLQAYGVEPIAYSVGNTFYNNIVDNCSNRMYPDSISTGGGGGGLLWIAGQKNMTIDGNYLSDTSRATGRNGNIIFSVEGWMQGLTYTHNTSWSDPNVASISTGNAPWNIALEFWNDRGGMEFGWNTFYGGQPIDQGGNLQEKGSYAYSFWVHDNIFIRDKQVSAPGIRGDGGWTAEGVVQDAIFERNKIINLTGTGASVIIGYTSDRNSHNITIRNNLFLNIGYANGASSYAMQIAMNRQATNVRDTIQDIYVYNNTFKNTGGGKVYGNIMIKNDTTLNLIKRIYIQNNILLDAPAYGYLTFYETQGTGNVNAGFIDSVFSNHNIIYNCGTDTAFYRQASNTNGSRNTTNTKLYAGSNINLDPLLDTTTYLPLPGSPAIGAAINVGLPTTNIGYYGNVLPITNALILYGNYKFITN